MLGTDQLRTPQCDLADVASRAGIRTIVAPQTWIVTQGKISESTLLICLVAVAAFFFHAKPHVRISDRVAIAQGQSWRLLSAKRVHLSTVPLLVHYLPRLLAVGRRICGLPALASEGQKLMPRF